MPAYITLIQFTQQGIENIKESPERLDAARAAVEAAGGKFVGFYLTMGWYDAVIISGGPDDKTTAKRLPATDAQGDVRTETVRVFPEDGYRQPISDLPG